MRRGGEPSDGLHAILDTNVGRPSRQLRRSGFQNLPLETWVLGSAAAASTDELLRAYFKQNSWTVELCRGPSGAQRLLSNGFLA